MTAKTRWIFISLVTQCGIIGYGEATLSGQEKAVSELFAQYVRRYLKQNGAAPRAFFPAIDSLPLAALLARYRGEEFVVVLSTSSLDEAVLVAERIQASRLKAALPHLASEVSSTVTVSMGISLSGSSISAAGIIAHADEALYRAKQPGRNRWVKQNPA